MPLTVVLVGTRKGCFILESDGDRRDWKVRGPYCEGWPIYHAVHDADSGAIYAAAASEWHGAGVWRSTDLGETWELSSEGLAYDDGGQKLSKVSGLTVAHGRILAGAENAGIFESRDGAKTWSLLSTLDGMPSRENWNDPKNQPPGHLGLPAILPHPDDASHFWAVVQGVGIFETVDDGASWTPRNRGLRADWPLEDPEVGYCVHKLVMSPLDTQRLYQQNHVGMHRSDDGGNQWVEITEGLPTEFGFAAATHPHDKETFYVIPLDPATGASCRRAGHRCGARATRARRGSVSTTACRSATRTSACCARGWRSTRSTCPASTSARAPARCSRAPTRATAGPRSRATCRRSRRSRSPSFRSHGRRAISPERSRRCSATCRAASTSMRQPSAKRSRDSTSAGPACATASARAGRSFAHTSTCTSTASAQR